jgi:hypothetical protein
MFRYKLLLIAICACLLQSCTNDDIPGQVPSEISQFIAQYYPSYSYESYQKTSSAYTIKLKSGPCLIFNSKQKWTEVNGNGETLTQYFLFDQLPPAVYEYLQETENLGNVYAVTRSTTEYSISLFDSVLTYEISGSRISVSYG